MAGQKAVDGGGSCSGRNCQKWVILVSQRFRLERALFLAQAAGLEADDFVVQDASLHWRLRVRSRELQRPNARNSDARGVRRAFQGAAAES